MIEHPIILEIERRHRRAEDLIEAERLAMYRTASASQPKPRRSGPLAALRALLGWVPAQPARTQ